MQRNLDCTVMQSGRVTGATPFYSIAGAPPPSMFAAEQEVFGGVSSWPNRKKKAPQMAGAGALGSFVSVMGSGQWIDTSFCRSLSTVVSQLVVLDVKLSFILSSCWREGPVVSGNAVLH